MTRHPAHSRMVLVSTLALFGSFACKKDDPTIPANEYAQHMAYGLCEAAFNCQCETPFVNFNECFAELTTEFSDATNEAYNAALAYDGGCPVDQLEQVEQLACKGWVAPLPANVCIPPCNTWYGPFTAGQACEVVVSAPELGIAWSTCAQGLTCFAGVCVDPCQSGTLPGLGEPCPDFVCEAGATCDLATQICVAMPDLPGVGEPCADGVCDPTVAVCVIEANVCAALPGAGQPCVQGQCNPSSYCEADVCVARPPLVCGLLAGVNPGDGDGDGDPTTGDGDGDPTTGDGDGDGDGDCNSTPLPGLPGIMQNGSTLDGTMFESGTCGGGGSEVSFTYVAPSAGLYEISTEGSDYDTVLYVRDGDCTGAELACDDDAIAPASLVQVSLVSQQEVTIFVDGYSGAGNFVLSINLI